MFGQFLKVMGCFDTNAGDEEYKVKKDANKKIEKQLQKDRETYRATHRLLLLGEFSFWLGD